MAGGKIKSGPYEFKKVMDFFDGYVFIVMLVEIYIAYCPNKIQRGILKGRYDRDDSLPTLHFKKYK
jgi:hypothetical protein